MPAAPTPEGPDSHDGRPRRSLLSTATGALPPLRRLVEQRDRLAVRHDRLLEQTERLQDEVARLTAERDAARREAELASPPEAPASYSDSGLEFLFVVTYGRSGSTLLMGLLDALPGFCIRGENNGICYDLFQYHRKAIQSRSAWATTEPLAVQHPWYGIDGYPDEVAFARLRQLVLDTLLRPEPDTKVTGFKDIRWWMPHPVEYLDFLEALFPSARFILNTRNLEDVANSKWYRNRPNAQEALAKVEERLKDTVGRRGERGYHVHFDDYVADPTVLRGLCEWLSVEYDADRVAEILGTKHSF